MSEVLPVQTNAVVRRLNALSPLSIAGAAALSAVLQERARHLAIGRDLIHEGDTPDGIRMILSGWASRYKMLEDGRRQIIGFLLPGNTCDFNLYLLREMDHSIAALTPVAYAEVPRDVLEQLTASHPSIARALWRETVVDAAIQRAWTVTLGRRDALERIAHLFCEVFLRLRAIGHCEGDTCSFPVTQVDLADATGLSAVHVNRVIQELRAAGLIVLRDKLLTVRDLQRLQDAAFFNANYLHLRQNGIDPGKPASI